MIRILGICFSSIILIVLLWNYDELVERTKIEETPSSEEVDLPQGVQPNQFTTSELRRFVSDATFFDSDKEEFIPEIMAERLTLLVTSVEKDLRITILNSKGNLVRDNEFNILLNNKEEYKDVNQDGMIYIANLNAGSYSVALQPVEGYEVSDSNIHVTVKDTVQYSVIEDISYLMKTENEIDASIEDTGEQNAEFEKDETENVNPKFSDVGYTFGIDVSKWNTEINWQQVAEYGVDFAIIRMGYRGSTTGALVEDPYFRKNVEGATAAGIKVGLYFFTQAINEVEAVEEASLIAAMASDYKLDYPIFIDTESAGGSGRADALGVEERTNVCVAFCETVENAGYRAGIYASTNWYDTKLEYDRLSDYVIWLAQYAAEPTFGNDYHMWQYTSSGSVPGMNGRVDLNISYIK